MAHEVWAIAASWSVQRGASLPLLLEAVGWSGGHTFLSSYWRQGRATDRPVVLPGI
jgi:hypothetical protein